MEVPLFFLSGASNEPPWAGLPRLVRPKPFLMRGGWYQEYARSSIKKLIQVDKSDQN